MLYEIDSLMAHTSASLPTEVWGDNGEIFYREAPQSSLMTTDGRLRGGGGGLCQVRCRFMFGLKYCSRATGGEGGIRMGEPTKPNDPHN